MGLISIVTIIAQVVIALHPAPVRQKVDTCAGFQQLIKATYGFNFTEILLALVWRPELAK